MGKTQLGGTKEGTTPGQVCKGKDRDMKKKPDPNFPLDYNSILWKVIKLTYTTEPAIVVPKKMNICYHYRIPQCQRTQRHQQHGQHDHALFLVDWYAERHTPAYQHLQAVYTISSNQDVNQSITFRNSAGTICRLHNGLHWAPASHIERS